MNPDPVAKLAQFTPAPSADAAELLFAAGRASARTHWGWKVAVAALVASNVALACVPRASLDQPRRRCSRGRPRAVTHPHCRNRAAARTAEFRPRQMSRGATASLRASDLEQRRGRNRCHDLTPPRESLTVLSGRRGELD